MHFKCRCGFVAAGGQILHHCKGCGHHTPASRARCLGCGERIVYSRVTEVVTDRVVA